MNEIILALLTILPMVENSSTDNLKENAIGVYQIRPIFVRDVNRISGENFTHDDARNKRKAAQMTFLYLTYYGNKYKERHGKPLTARTLGMMVNGGPFGYLNKSAAAMEYGQRCQNLYDQRNNRRR